MKNEREWAKSHQWMAQLAHRKQGLPCWDEAFQPAYPVPHSCWKRKCLKRPTILRVAVSSTSCFSKCQLWQWTMQHNGCAANPIAPPGYPSQFHIPTTWTRAVRKQWGSAAHCQLIWTTHQGSSDCGIMEILASSMPSFSVWTTQICWLNTLSPTNTRWIYKKIFNLIKVIWSLTGEGGSWYWDWNAKNRNNV